MPIIPEKSLHPIDANLMSNKQCEKEISNELNSKIIKSKEINIDNQQEKQNIYSTMALKKSCENFISKKNANYTQFKNEEESNDKNPKQNIKDNLFSIDVSEITVEKEDFNAKFSSFLIDVNFLLHLYSICMIVVHVRNYNSYKSNISISDKSMLFSIHQFFAGYYAIELLLYFIFCIKCNNIIQKSLHVFLLTFLLVVCVFDSIFMSFFENYFIQYKN